MEALVTGATGLVGCHLVKRLFQGGDRVRTLVRDPERARTLAQQGISLVRGDLHDPDALRRATEGVEVVYHCAGRVALPFQGDRAELWKTNVEGTANILEASATSGVGQFVFTSSVAVYGEVDREGVDEGHPLSPRGPYAESKAAAERLVGEFQRHRGLESAIIRPCAIYGPGDRNFLPLILETLSRRRFPLVDGGHQPLDLVYVTDVAEALVLAGTRAEAAGEAYNVTDGERHSIRELAQLLRAVAPVPLRTIEVPFPIAYGLAALGYACGKLLRPGAEPLISPASVRAMTHPHHYDISKIGALGYRPRVHLEEGLRRTVEWYLGLKRGKQGKYDRAESGDGFICKV